jgi:hypothetical protein
MRAQDARVGEVTSARIADHIDKERGAAGPALIRDRVACTDPAADRIWPICRKIE